MSVYAFGNDQNYATFGWNSHLETFFLDANTDRDIPEYWFGRNFREIFSTELLLDIVRLFENLYVDKEIEDWKISGSEDPEDYFGGFEKTNNHSYRNGERTIKETLLAEYGFSISVAENIENLKKDQISYFKSTYDKTVHNELFYAIVGTEEGRRFIFDINMEYIFRGAAQALSENGDRNLEMPPVFSSQKPNAEDWLTSSGSPQFDKECAEYRMLWDKC